jgi:carbamoyltransferase
MSVRFLLAVSVVLQTTNWCAALSTRPNLNAKLIVGLNKYSHDASCCIVDSSNGKILFSQAKERLSRYKHDGGAVGDLVNYGLQSIGANIEDIAMVVSNNHHYRVLPFERRLPLYKNIKYTPLDYSDPTNLLPDAQHLELSHHMAHAYSVIATSPFDEGLVLVMDGMGESYKAMFEDIAGIEEHSGDYMHDLKLLKTGGADGFVGQPLSLYPGSGYREAETAYVFRGNKLKPVFKRWTRERSPPELYNHGFENMESMGAVYSRISSHILGDWNACGKIMGLAPWSGKHRNDAAEWFFPKANKKAEKTSAQRSSYRADVSQLGLGDRFYHEMNFMSGNPYDGSFKVNWNELEKLENPNSWSDATFDDHANIAQSVQKNLESCALSLVKSLKDATGQKNIALTGGVALNSVLNGRILKEMGFENTFVPPGPGDEGIAVGCAMYGLQVRKYTPS